MIWFLILGEHDEFCGSLGFFRLMMVLVALMEAGGRA